MKKTLLIAVAGLGLAGCVTNHYERGSAGPVYEISSGSGPKTVVEVDHPHRQFGDTWENWHYDNNPDRLTPQLHLDPLFPPGDP
jgi:hypothetical protein